MYKKQEIIVFVSKYQPLLRYVAKPGGANRARSLCGRIYRSRKSDIPVKITVEFDYHLFGLDGKEIVFD
jgi:hypothetical protein